MTILKMYYAKTVKKLLLKITLPKTLNKFAFVFYLSNDFLNFPAVYIIDCLYSEIL